MSEPLAYLNDRFMPASQAKLNIYDLGIVLGATLTEDAAKQLEGLEAEAFAV